MKTIYISGPMRGKPGYNFQAFDDAAVRLREAGWIAVNPADLDRGCGAKPNLESDEFIKNAMRRDLSAIFDCDALALLPGWRQSAGAVAEVSLACVLRMPSFDAVTIQDITPDVYEWWHSVIGRVA